MGFTKADLRADILANLGNPSKLADTSMDQHINEAVVVYSRLRPLAKVADLTGNGSQYDFSVPSGFQDGFSTLLSIEYPQGNQVPTFLSSTEWVWYQSPSELFIRFVTTPSNGEVARVTYTATHTVDSDNAAACTIIDADKPAIVYLATAKSALELAGFAARQARNTETDIPLLPGPVADYRNLAEEYMGMFFEHMGMPADGSKPAAWSSGYLKALPSWDSSPLIRERRSPIPSR